MTDEHGTPMTALRLAEIEDHAQLTSDHIQHGGYLTPMITLFHGLTHSCCTYASLPTKSHPSRLTISHGHAARLTRYR